MATPRPTVAAMKKLRLELDRMERERNDAHVRAEGLRQQLLASERKRGEQMQRFAELSAWLSFRVGTSASSSVPLTLTEVTALREWLKHGQPGATHIQVHPFARWDIRPTPEEAYAGERK